MSLFAIDGHLLRDMILAGAAQMEKNREGVDALNVFPVPDGDTGTNMMLTMKAAAHEVKPLSTGHAGRVAEAAATGALKGARGNSGVILSQLYRGFSKAVDGGEIIDAKLYAAALRAGVDMAYKAVMKPREGTILTVARAVADALTLSTSRLIDDISDLMGEALKVGNETLLKTPDMLPILKQAGVVDAGGKGLLFIYAGYKMAADGEEFEADFGTSVTRPNFEMVSDDEAIEFGYCTEMFIKNLREGVAQSHIDHFRQKLTTFGDSVIVVSDDDLIKVHVHSNQPGKVLHMAQLLGELSGVKIDNMREQHRSIHSIDGDAASAGDGMPSPRKPMGLVSVAAGEGLCTLLTELCVDVVVQGGQSMNPSIDEIACAIRKCNAQCVFVLPNNSNIILAARQAAELCEDIDVRVIPTKSVPQGVAGLIAFVPDGEPDENELRINNAFAGVLTGQITNAVRRSTFDGMEIKEGDTLGLIDGRIAVKGDSAEAVMDALLERTVTPDTEMLTLFFGEGVDKDAANAVAEAAGKRYPHIDVELMDGGQPLYHYLFAVK